MNSNVCEQIFFGDVFFSVKWKVSFWSEHALFGGANMKPTLLVMIQNAIFYIVHLTSPPFDVAYSRVNPNIILQCHLYWLEV